MPKIPNILDIISSYIVPFYIAVTAPEDINSNVSSPPEKHLISPCLNYLFVDVPLLIVKGFKAICLHSNES